MSVPPPLFTTRRKPRMTDKEADSTMSEATMISAKDVKQLRDMTGAGMMDCKRALTETDGDLDKAVDLLRTKFALKASKRAERENLSFSAC